MSKALGQSTAFGQSLMRLGFSQYESRCYVGLLGPEPLTGYGVAKITGVPQPKVYETLRKLTARGAAREISGDPVRFAAVPPESLLADIRASLEERLETATELSKQASDDAPANTFEHVERLTSLAQVIGSATRSLGMAERRVYLSAGAEELNLLREPIRQATGRGVEVVVLSLGPVPTSVEELQPFDHGSTHGAILRHHRAKHVALVADSRQTVCGVAPDDQPWNGIATASVPIICAVKSFIKHDIDMQQVYADFGP